MHSRFDDSYVNGLDEKSRREILDSIYYCEIPTNFKFANSKKWENPKPAHD
jgi:hypothetical protein